MDYGSEKFYGIGFHQAKSKFLAFCVEPEISGTLFQTQSKKGSHFEFGKTKKFIGLKNQTGKKPIIFSKEDFLTISEFGSEKILTLLNKTGKTSKLLITSGKNYHDFQFKSVVPGVKERGVIVPDYKCKKNYVLYFGEKNINIAFSKDLKKWVKIKHPVIKSRPGFFDKDNLKIIGAIKASNGILILYNSSTKTGDHFKIQIGAVIFSVENPQNIIWRSSAPVLEHETKDELSCKGVIFDKERIMTYWTKDNHEMIVFSFYNQFNDSILETKGKKLERHKNNPIITPSSENWCNMGTLNPTAVLINGEIHLLFRVIGEDGVSRIAYAKSKDGFHIDEIYPEPVFAINNTRNDGMKKTYSLVLYPSGGSWGGIEDPRIAKIGNRIYMTFNSFDGWDNMRVGLTSITVDDLLNKKWNWEKTKLISPGRAKNWLLFPEKINGRYALLHSIYGETPDKVRVEFFNDLDKIDAKDMNFKSPNPQVMPDQRIAWHVHMRSATTTPIKTKDGWLVFYHAHSAGEGHRYKIGAMLLGLNNPEHVVARSSYPILLPDAWYENDGKPGIVYACGSVVKNGTLYVYYGGGDKYVCVATAPLNKFLENLKKNKNTEFTVKNVVFS